MSPLLANIFRPLDPSMARRRAGGRVVAGGYADDVLMGFDSKADAQEMLLALKARLASFGLMLHEGKTW
ncbi:hypothetical protein BSZ22_02070 [Bradyrhizobium canariense]|uniref:Reverse transcriptase domain-containing protein n=2 Tax=Bradyrhizobium canariense TaxID=255045 RepID=A0A1X3GTK5_9BRAD|nr:hypothetical protein BSZ22_02070 [Bradyrhizobium canariense]OSI82335.1 hypothetical protein BSZ23_02075 [Bradyrhizobium canariense]OSI96628.1 hypothetical protein BSZ25_01730 [Bradyrhizobium canariense]OSI98353.1 hypothetical protein BSZ24_01770 [Bradyrhizobium canariense]OSJ15685.1 hypothetical protein BSZ16_01785 [Bradyrhizobium canariense]